MIELENLREIASGDEGFVISVLALFVSKENEYSGIVELAIKHKDPDELRQIVHKIKSSVSVLGMSQFSNNLGLLEKKLYNKELAFPAAAIEAQLILKEFHEAEKEAKELLKQLRLNA